MTEILARIVIGLFAAALFGGFPALFCILLIWKVVRSRQLKAEAHWFV